MEELARMLAATRESVSGVLQSWESRTNVCPTLSEGVGLCSVFGDPHFITFDGGHTYFLGERVIWLVKSADVWIQGISKQVTGNFAGIAIGGPFMLNHTLVLFGTAFHNDGQMRAFYDGNQILSSLDVDGNADFSSEWVKGSRRAQWEPALHNEAVLNIKPAIEFDVGPWRSRFEGGPSGGLFMFRFARHVEVTATGVDFLSAVIHMPKQPGGQSGYCGDFDGNPDDDFDPPLPGSVPPEIAAAFNRPAGEGLEQVPQELNMFNTVKSSDVGAASLAYTSSQRVDPAKKAKDTEDTFCSRERRAMAEKACEDIPDEFVKMSCVMDVCATGRTSAAASASDGFVLESYVEAEGVPVFVGHGRCVDKGGRRYHGVLARPRYSSPQRCQALLRALADVPGALGAQRRPEGGCLIAVDAASQAMRQPGGGRPRGAEEPEDWAEFDGQGRRQDVLGDGGSGRVAGASDEVGWSCWLLN